MRKQFCTLRIIQIGEVTMVVNNTTNASVMFMPEALVHSAQSMVTAKQHETLVSFVQPLMGSPVAVGDFYALLGCSALQLEHIAVLSSLVAKCGIMPAAAPMVMDGTLDGDELDGDGVLLHVGDMEVMGDLKYDGDVVIVGNLHVHGGVDVGGSMYVLGASVSVGEYMAVHDDMDMPAGSTLHVEHDFGVGCNLQAGVVSVGFALTVEQHCSVHSLDVGETINVGRTLTALGNVECGNGALHATVVEIRGTLKTAENVVAAISIAVDGGITALAVMCWNGSIRCDNGDILATSGPVFAGRSISAGGVVESGELFRITAGALAAINDGDGAQITCKRKPLRLAGDARWVKPAK